MGRQTLLLAIKVDDQSLLATAFSLGAVLVCGPVLGGRPRLLSKVEDYDSGKLFARFRAGVNSPLKTMVAIDMLRARTQWKRLPEHASNGLPRV